MSKTEYFVDECCRECSACGIEGFTGRLWCKPAKLQKGLSRKLNAQDAKIVGVDVSAIRSDCPKNYQYLLQH